MVKENCNVLVVDSDPQHREFLAGQVSQIPGMAVSAMLPDAHSAVNYLLEYPIDILITEIKLPGMDGLELAEYCHEKELGCAVIIVSDVKEFDYAKRALQNEVLDYLLKPFQFPQLVKALEYARSKVRLSRFYIRAHLPSSFRELEQSICRSFENGDPPVWIEQVNRLFTVPGELLRVSHALANAEPRDLPFTTYKNILSLLLRGSVILSICREPNSELFLLIHKKDYPTRTIQSLRGWFSHIITHEVTLTPEGTVESAQQLAALAMNVKAPDRNKIIEMACAYIQSHLSEPLSREELAAKFYVSPSHFGRLFKKATGVCYNEYLNDLRISNAKVKLSQNISIREVAAAVGFRNVKYFSELFCKKTGYMPTEYRRALLTGAIKQDESL